MNTSFGDYQLSDDKSIIQIERVYEMLSKTHFAKDRSKEIIRKSIENTSICLGIYMNNVQVGFARCITDFATTYYLLDVVVDEEHRGKGLGKALTKFITEHEALWTSMGVLGTEDAHGLYEQFGFIRDNGMYRPPTSAL